MSIVAGSPAEMLPLALWIVLGGLGVVLAALLLALLSPARLAPSGARWTAIGGGVLGLALPALMLTLAAAPAAGTLQAPVIEVIARQFWWEIRYPSPSRGGPPVVTANELHIPVGTEVRLHLTSGDVIHGFAVPGLGGAAELVPGRVEVRRLRAETPGLFRGACYAFCGTQHAHMALPVVAMPRAAWLAWLREQSAPAAPPEDAPVLRGREIFMASGCGSCHAVRGHGADGRAGPDLTHFASRETIGAGMLPNTRSALTGWIAATQQIKPGALMPSFNLLTGPELHALASYLQALR